jgi:hypothetical protein
MGARRRAPTRDHGPAYADGAMRFLRSLLNFAKVEFEAPDGTPLLRYNPIDRLTQTRAWNRVRRRTALIQPSQLGLGSRLSRSCGPTRSVRSRHPQAVAEALILAISDAGLRGKLTAWALGRVIAEFPRRSGSRR